MKLTHALWHQHSVESPMIHERRLQKINAKIVTFINNICERIVTAIAHANELQVWQTRDRFGNTSWHAYDPATGSSTCLNSEAEMRMWIEERYYQM